MNTPRLKLQFARRAFDISQLVEGDGVMPTLRKLQELFADFETLVREKDTETIP